MQFAIIRNINGVPYLESLIERDSAEDAEHAFKEFADDYVSGDHETATVKKLQHHQNAWRANIRDRNQRRTVLRFTMTAAD